MVAIVIIVGIIVVVILMLVKNSTVCNTSSNNFYSNNSNNCSSNKSRNFTIEGVIVVIVMRARSVLEVFSLGCRWLCSLHSCAMQLS